MTESAAPGAPSTIDGGNPLEDNQPRDPGDVAGGVPATPDAVTDRSGGVGTDGARAAGRADNDSTAEAPPDADGTAEASRDDEPLRGEALLVQEGDIAADYLERLLDILDYDGDIDLDVEGERAVVAVVGGNLKGLVGPNGATLDAMQELTRLAVAQQTGVRTRLMLDVDGYRAKRRTELTTLARQEAEKVASSGSQRKLAPMNPFERKVVHDAVATVDGVSSESEGEEPTRCVVILPA